MTALCNWQISGFHSCLLATSIHPFPLYLKIVSTGFIYLGSHWEVLSSILSVPFSLSDVGEVIPGLRVWSCLDDQRWQRGFSQAQVWCVISEASWKNFLIYAPNSDQEECSLVIFVRCFPPSPLPLTGFLCSHWLSWNSLCIPGWPRTLKSACLCLPSAGIKVVCHYDPASLVLFIPLK